MKAVLILAISALLLIQPAIAATVSIEEKEQTGLTIGALFSFDILLSDFPETVGGGFDLDFNNDIISSVDSFVCAAIWDTQFCDFGITPDGDVEDAVAATFALAQIPSGNLVMGTLTVQLASAGTTVLDLSGSLINPWATLLGEEIDVDYVDSTLTFDGTTAAITTGVPEPVSVPALGAVHPLLPLLVALAGVMYGRDIDRRKLQLHRTTVA